MRNLLICLSLATALSACSGEPPMAGDNQAINTTDLTNTDVGGTNSGEAANGATPAASPTAVSSLLLDPYVGRYPHEAVNGVKFYDQPQVKAAVQSAVIDPTIRNWIFGENGPQVPIVKLGDRYAAWGCEKSNCGARNWTVLLTADAKSAQVCYKPDGSDTPSWYEMGVKLPRTDECPAL